MSNASRRVLSALVTSLTLIAIGSPSAAAGTSSNEPSVILRDGAGDANGVNDQSEGLLHGLGLGHNIAEADLTTLGVSPLTNRRGHTFGLRFVITTTGTPGHIPRTGTPLRYTAVMQLTPDCRMSVSYVGTGAHADGAAELSSSCNNEGVALEQTPLRSRVAGNRIMIRVPYRSGPPEMRGGEVVEYTGMLSSAAPIAAHTDARVYTTQIDNAATHSGWVLPQ